MMPHFSVQRFFKAAVCAVIVPMPLAAERFEIRDIEGFERPMVAHVATVPDGWNTTGRIAWNKPCSSNDLYETLFSTRSPDGSSGARIMPGFQFMIDRAQLAPGYPPDPMLNMMLAQSEAMNQNMATQFRGSNCGVGQLNGTEDVLNRLILPNRPQDVRILGAQANRAEIDMMRQTFGPSLPGVSVSFDSQIIDLGYTLNSRPTTERLYLSWYTFSQEPFDMGGIIVSNSHTIVEPLRFVWTQSTNANTAIPQLEGILSSIRTNPDWQRRVAKVREDINKRNQSDRTQREAESDRRHKEFIDMITGTPGSSAVSGGIAPVPDSSSAEADTSGIPSNDDKNFWGEEKTEEEKKWDF